MPDDKEAEAHAAEIERTDATEDSPRGNVHSEAEPSVEQSAPPPLPH